jgi:hypothetical protein
MIAAKISLEPLVVLKLWTTPRQNVDDPNEVMALERAIEEGAWYGHSRRQRKALDAA